jgi:predicted dinucleotide-binding enzyme
MVTSQCWARAIASSWKAGVAQNPKGAVGSFADAARFGELLVLAVKGTVAAEALRAAGIINPAGKPVIDATNPIADAPPANGVLRFFTNLDESLMERLQREFESVRFVKAFNSVGNACMVDPRFKGGKPTMFICGNDSAAKKTVSGILDQFGLGDGGYGRGRGSPHDRAVSRPCLVAARRAWRSNCKAPDPRRWTCSRQTS